MAMRLIVRRDAIVARPHSKKNVMAGRQSRPSMKMVLDVAALGRGHRDVARLGPPRLLFIGVVAGPIAGESRIHRRP